MIYFTADNRVLVNNGFRTGIKLNTTKGGVMGACPHRGGSGISRQTIGLQAYGARGRLPPA